MRTKIARLTTRSLILGALLAPMAALAQNETNHGPIGIPPDGRGNLIRQLPPRGQSGSGGSVVQGNGISYHNGPVMHGVNIYYIWYGDWSQDSTANAILTDYAKYVGGSSYFNINTTYGDTSGNVPNTPATIKYGSSSADTGSLGTSLSDNSIWTLVSAALSKGALPVDANGVYFVLTAPYVAETSGFLTQYCGWHTANYYGSTPIKYAFVGNAAANMGACSVQSTGPNGDAQADAMASVLAHELEEAATDPLLNAWYDPTGAENADKCAWTFGATYAANGAQANMTIGSRNYLIQQNWVNAGGGYCAVSYVGTPDFSLSVSPGSQTVQAGQTTGAYTVTPTASNGWSGTVTYSVTAGLPAGAFASVSGNLITVSTTAGTTPAGSYNFTISGTDGTLTHTTQATLVVTVPAAPTFSISISPSSQSTRRPSGSNTATATYTVTVTGSSGYSGTVNLSAGGNTTGFSVSIAPASITNGGTATLTATVTSSSKKGNHGLTVTGNDGTTTKSASASLQVN